MKSATVLINYLLIQHYSETKNTKHLMIICSQMPDFHLLFIERLVFQNTTLVFIQVSDDMVVFQCFIVVNSTYHY